MSYKIHSNCLKAGSVALLLLFFQMGAAQSLFSEIDAIIASTQKVLGPDVVYMVANKDTILYQKSSKIFTGRSQAQMGHSTQWLTAAVIMVLVDEGKLSLDDKVSSYLPVFEKYGKNYITIRHCLSHFTGIQAEPASRASKLLEKKKFASLEEEVAYFAAKEIQTNPGTEFRYSVIGPAIAARVAEVIYKKGFDMLAQQKLFRPLGMRQTTFSTLDASAIKAAVGARSTANDMIRFLTMLLNNGMYKGQKIISEEAVKELRKVQTTPALIKYAPEALKGFNYVAGAWAPEQNSAKEATLLIGPSFGGTLPIVDFCRGYAFLLLLKEEKDDPKANVYAEVKKVMDNRFRKQCN